MQLEAHFRKEIGRMTEEKNEEIELAEEVVHPSLVIYNVKDSYVKAFRSLMRKHMGNSGSWAFEQLIEAYQTSLLLGNMAEKIGMLEERVANLENKDKRSVKTFRRE